MPSLFGNPNERWPLSRAVDAMVSSARRTGFPALIWIAGILYPSLTLGIGISGPILSVLEASTGLELKAGSERIAKTLADWNLTPTVSSPTVLSMVEMATEASFWIALLLLLPVCLIVARLSVGLARVSESRSWQELAGSRRTPTLPAVWRTGGGLSFSTIGLLLSFPLLLMAAVLFLIGPLILLLNLVEPIRQLPSFIAVLVVPVGLTTLAYAVVLQVLIQLALHSLARNRRGSASALTHAWRLVRNSPWGAARAMLVDLTLQIALLMVMVALGNALGNSGTALSWVLLGFIGATRASYWAETYEGLGGLSTVREPVSASGSAIRAS